MSTLMERLETRERSRSRTPCRGASSRRSASVDRRVASTQRSETAVDYEARVRRSFTPVRELARSASTKYLSNYDYSPEHGLYRPAYPVSKSDGYLRNASNPFVITTHAIEDHPIGKYDVFIPGGWSYPIYKYLHKSYRPDNSYLVGGRYQPRRDYAFHNAYRPSYLAGEMSYYHGDINRALSNYRKWASPTYSTTSTPWYRSYFGDTALRHFGGYRPRQIQHFMKAIWV